MRRLILAAFLLSAMPVQAAELYNPIRTQSLGFGTTARYLTEAFGNNIEGIRVHCTAACYVAFGVSSALSVTSATGVMIPANVPQDFAVRGGNIGVIQVSGTGIMSVTELSK